jgi:hypothetical protein
MFMPDGVFESGELIPNGCSADSIAKPISCPDSQPISDACSQFARFTA